MRDCLYPGAVGWGGGAGGNALSQRPGKCLANAIFKLLLNASARLK